MDDKVSIIMPVYNIEKIKKKFIKAVNSVLKSTYKNIELLLINDGSTDKSLDILHKLKKEHSCIIIYSKKMKGSNQLVDMD